MSVAGSRRTAEGALEAKDAADDDEDEDEDDNDDDAEEEDDGEEGRRIGSVGGADAVAIARSLDTRPRTSAVIRRCGGARETNLVSRVMNPRESLPPPTIK
jgi:hypothetical protein